MAKVTLYRRIAQYQAQLYTWNMGTMNSEMKPLFI